MEKGDHIVAFVNHQCVHVARRLEQIASGRGHPVALEIAPFAFDDEAVDGSRMTMARDDTGLGYLGDVNPIALADIEAQGGPTAGAVRNPKAVRSSPSSKSLSCMSGGTRGE